MDDGRSARVVFLGSGLNGLKRMLLASTAVGRVLPVVDEAWQQKLRQVFHSELVVLK